MQTILISNFILIEISNGVFFRIVYLNIYRETIDLYKCQALTMIFHMKQKINGYSFKKIVWFEIYFS